jgi:hypothetical protein
VQVERSMVPRSRSGQATTEWMVVVAVIVVAVVSIGWVVAQTFPSDMEGLGSRAKRMYASGNLAR